MRVVVCGGTGVLGRAAVGALVAADHDVDVVARSSSNVPVIEALGARARAGDLLDPASLAPLFEGADAVVNLATHLPVGYAAIWPRSWREYDLLRTEGVASVVEATRRSGVRRLVQESVSFVYADHGDAWITEESPVDITSATEPAAVGESHVQAWADGSHVGVVLRFGNHVGDDDQTRFWLKAAAQGRPVGVGRREQWAHVVHTDDLGPAVVAALRAPSGVYNVGAEPVLRGELADGYAKAAGAERGELMGPMLRRLAGPRVEPLTRSLRVRSELFAAQTGWSPVRPTFDPAWLEAAHQPREATTGG